MLDAPLLAELRTALRTASETGHVAFVFDSEATGSDAYGHVCEKALFEAIPRDATSLIRLGDVIGGPSHARRDLLTEHMEIVRPMPEGNASRFYVVAMTGLTEDAVSAATMTLRGRPYFLGTIDLATAEPVATLFGNTLVSKAVLHRGECLEPGETLADGTLAAFDGRFAWYGRVLRVVEEHVWLFDVEPAASEGLRREGGAGPS